MSTKRIMPLVTLALMATTAPRAVLGFPRAEVSNVEKLLADVKDELGRVGGDLKKTAEDALKQSRDAGKVSAEVKESADKLLTQHTALQSAHDKLSGKLEAIEERQKEVEQSVAANGKNRPTTRKSLGQTFAESDELNAFVKAGLKGTATLTVKSAITSSNTSAGDLIMPHRESEIVRLPRRQLFIRQLLTQGRTGSNLVEYAKHTVRTNNARVVTEGTQKPESNYVWDKADAPVRTIAHWVAVSKQAGADAAQLQTEINSELLYGLELNVEEEILNGDGTGEHLSGLVTEATAFDPAFSVSDETMIDRLRLALLQASLAEYPADGIVLHPTDWARIELTKDSTLRYLFANPVGVAGPVLWGTPVVATQSMDVDDFLTGAFRTAATVYDREEATVAISSEDRDNFVKNMLTVLAEERLALAVKRPAALIYGQFENE